MNSDSRFFVLVVVSFLAFAGVLRFVLRHREQGPRNSQIMWVAALVVLGGMLFARYGAQLGLPWWIYYTIPMLLTVFLPPLVFLMSARESGRYIVLAFLSAPFIHSVFSFFLGWHEYMPFLKIPSLLSIIGVGGNFWDCAGSAQST